MSEAFLIKLAHVWIARKVLEKNFAIIFLPFVIISNDFLQTMTTLFFFQISIESTLTPIKKKYQQTHILPLPCETLEGPPKAN